MTSGPDSGDGLNVSRRGGWRRAVRWSRIECADEASRLLAYCPHAGERRLLPAGGRGGPSGSTQPGAQNHGAVTGNVVEAAVRPMAAIASASLVPTTSGPAPCRQSWSVATKARPAIRLRGAKPYLPFGPTMWSNARRHAGSGGEASRPRGRAASRRCTHVSVSCPLGPTPGGENRRCALLRKSSTSSAVVR